MATKLRRIRTPLRARLRFAAYAARLLGGRLLALAALLVLGGLALQWRGDPADVGHLDLAAACYHVYTQLFFEHLIAFPDDWLLRCMFFVIPIAGVFMAEGLL